VFRSSVDKVTEKMEMAFVKPVSATTMKPMMSSVKSASSTSVTTSAATTTSTTIAVKRKPDTHAASHSKRARKDGSSSGVYPTSSPQVFYIQHLFGG